MAAECTAGIGSAFGSASGSAQFAQRVLRRLLQQLRRAGLDLRRGEDAAETAGGVGFGGIDGFERPGEGLAAALGTPAEIEAVAVLHMPGRLAEAGGDIGARAAFGQRRQPAVVRAGDIDEGGDAAAQEIAQHDGERGLHRIVAYLDERRIFVHRLPPEGGGALVLEQAFRDRLLAGMAMHVDETGQDHAVAPGNLLRERPLVTAADMEEAGFVEGDVRVLHIGVAAGRLIIGDDGMGVADDGDVRHGSS